MQLADRRHNFQTTVHGAARNELFRVRIHETVSFVLREMVTAEGAFAASFDADSDGEEGKYYLWSKHELESLLAPDLSQLFFKHYDVSHEGNWEGWNILNRSAAIELADEQTERKLDIARRILFDRRKTRIPPAYDDKVVADWNGLMISALAEAALVFRREDWQLASIRAMNAAMDLLWHEERLLHTFRAKQAKHEATAEGYANLITAALKLHMLTGKGCYVQYAMRLTRALVKHFWDDKCGGIFFSSDLADGLITRTRSVADDATPNANGVMIGNFTSLYHLTGDIDYLQRAESILCAHSESIMASPFAAPTALKSWLMFTDAIQVVNTGPAALELFHKALPSIGLDIVYQNIEQSGQLTAFHPAYGKAKRTSPAQLFICRGRTCSPPVENLTELDDALNILGLPARS